MGAIRWAEDPIEPMNAASWLEGLPAPEKWRSFLTRRGPLGVTCLLVLGLAMQAGLMLTDMTGGITGWTGGSAPPLASTTAPGPHLGTNVALITNAHLFGVQPVAAPAPQDAATAPQSTIPLLLTGVVATDDPRGGLAIIGQQGQATRVYRVGETVPGGAMVHSVYSDRAVIDRAGHLEALLLPQKSTAGAIGTLPVPSSTVAQQAESPPLDRVRRLVNDQPGLIADIMRPQPVMGQDNKLQGYRVFPGRNHQAFSRLGLRPGDVVTAINGTPLDDFSKGPDVMRTLESSSEAHVTVLRNGQSQDLTLNVAQVAQEAEALAGPQAAVPAGALTPPQLPWAQGSTQ
jgi:general secretion pathway protein C